MTKRDFMGLPVVPAGSARYSAASAPSSEAPATSLGQCIIHTVWILGCRHLEIVQADEHVLIADEVLKAADSHPDVTYGDGILTIKALNGTVSYGIGKYDLLTNAHEAMRSPEPLGHAKVG